MIAVISGATGLVGSLLLPRLLNDKLVSKVISVGRRSAGVKHDKLEEVIAPEMHQLDAAKLKGDLYFCCLGTTIKVAGSQENFYRVDHDAVVEFGKVAKHHSAKSLLVVTASGANAKSMIFYNRVKGETERDLRALQLNRLVIFHPALLMGNRGEQRNAEQTFVKIAAQLESWIPASIYRRLATSADLLAAQMCTFAFQDGFGVQTVEASYI